MKMMSIAIIAKQIRKICRLSKYILYVFILNRYNFGIDFSSVLFILYSRISIILQYHLAQILSINYFRYVL